MRNPSLKGRGKLKCEICNKSIRNHRVGHPCPALGLLATDRMTVRKPHKGNTRHE